MTKAARAYNNGDIIVEVIEDNEVQAWRDYNVAHRPGCALFINTECVQFGYLGPESCKEMQQKLTERFKSEEVLQ